MAPSTAPEREVRIGLVLYGGVSLAIYMNGVVQEFLSLVKATSPHSATGASTQSVYQKLSRILAGQSSDGAGNPTRFLIDAIAGTSAGGINGVFLAKALALDGNLDQIKRLWVDEGDISRLLNDEGSIENGLENYDLQSPPASLLNSQRMYIMLLRALQGMKPGPGPSLASELDLHITATDLRGLVLPIQLSDGRVFERRHKTEFHFRHSEIDRDHADPASPTNQFTARFDPMLAFAARCTSSFPVAFEPMLFSDIDNALLREGILLQDPTAVSTDPRWQAFYPSYRPDAIRATGHPQLEFPLRSFADGGYLDNKPFGFVIDEILKRQGPSPIDRKLFYLEPDPEDPENDKIDPRRPNAIANAWMALSSLPRYETIRGDLERARDRNTEIQRLARLMKSIDAAAQIVEWPVLSGEDWVKNSSVDLAKIYGPGYTPYHCVKIASATDELTSLLYRHYEIDPTSVLAFRLRHLIEVWRDRTYKFPESGNDTLNQFLLQFDIGFRLRRLHHLFRKLDAAAPDAADHLRARINQIRARLVEPYNDLLRLQRSTHPAALAPLGTAADLRAMLKLDQDANTTEGLRISPSIGTDEYDRAAAVLNDPAITKRIDDATTALAKSYETVFRATHNSIRSAIKRMDGDDEATIAFCKALLETGNLFERHDMLTFPILFNSPIGQMDEIEIFRVSPKDAPIGGAPFPAQVKVKGAALGAFAGFLEREWRQNDILWGRLDGAERIITALLPEPAQQTQRDQLIAEAHLQIVQDEIANHPKIKPLHLAPNELLDTWMRTRLEQQQRKPWAETLARGTTIIGEILDPLTRRNSPGAGIAIVPLIGRLAWGLVEVATPRSFFELAFRYWLSVLLALGILLIFAGILFPPLQIAGWSLLALCVIAKLGTATLEDHFQATPTPVEPAVNQRPTLVLVAALAVAVLIPLVLFFAALGLSRAAQPLPPWTPRFAFAAAAVATGLTFCAMIKVARASKGVPIPSIEKWTLLTDIERDAGDLHDLRRTAIRKHLTADARFIAAYASLFISFAAALFTSGSHFAAAGLFTFGLAAALADYLENERISRNIAAPLRELTGPKLDLPVAPISRAKWIAFYAALPFAAYWLLTPLPATIVSLRAIAGAGFLASFLCGALGLLSKEKTLHALSLLLILIPTLPALFCYLIQHAIFK